MSQPSTRVGGVRGPLGGTLDDVISGLVDVRNAIDNLVSPVEDMALDLVVVRWQLATLIAPENVDAAWRGLPAFLAERVAPVSRETPLMADELNLARRQVEAISRTLGNVGDVGTDLPGRTMHELTGDLAAALTAGNGENVYERLGSVRDNSLALLQAIGSLPSTPAGETLKTLLKAMVDCCEGQGGGEGPQNPIPNLCSGSGSAPVQVGGYIQVDPVLELGGPAPTYQLDFGDLSGLTNSLFRDFDTVNGVPGYAYYNDDETVTLCIEWDVWGWESVGPLYLVRVGTGDYYTGGANSTPLAPLVIGAGSATAVVNAGVRFLFALDVPEGAVTPGGNFWLRVGGLA